MSKASEMLGRVESALEREGALHFDDAYQAITGDRTPSDTTACIDRRAILTAVRDALSPLVAMNLADIRSIATWLLADWEDFETIEHVNKCETHRGMLLLEAIGENAPEGPQDRACGPETDKAAPECGEAKSEPQNATQRVSSVRYYPDGSLECSVVPPQLPEGIEWPRFEDGEFVNIGDEFVTWSGETRTVGSITFNRNGTISVAHGCECFVIGGHDGHGKRVKRPAKDTWEFVEQDAKKFAEGWDVTWNGVKMDARALVERCKSLAGVGE